LAANAEPGPLDDLVGPFHHVSHCGRSASRAEAVHAAETHEAGATVSLREPPAGCRGSPDADRIRPGESAVIAKILAHLEKAASDRHQTELPLGARACPAACPSGQRAGFRQAEAEWVATRGRLHESGRRYRVL
jgi:hypothetical protein